MKLFENMAVGAVTATPAGQTMSAGQNDMSNTSKYYPKDGIHDIPAVNDIFAPFGNNKRKKKIKSLRKLQEQLNK